jgi:hypothetical protein
MMNIRMTAALAALISLAQVTAFAGNPATGCAAKIENIEHELALARERGNAHRVRGLEQALASAQTCDDKALQAERDAKIEQRQGELEKRQAELHEAQVAGDAADIAKAQRKLDKARQKLEEAQREQRR